MGFVFRRLTFANDIHSPLSLPGHPETSARALQPRNIHGSKRLVVGVRGCVTPRLYLSRHADAFSLRKREGQTDTARTISSRRIEMDDREKPGRFSQRYHRETGFIPLFPSGSFLLSFFFFFFLLLLHLPFSLFLGSFPFSYVSAKPMGYLWKLERPKNEGVCGGTEIHNEN